MKHILTLLLLWQTIGLPAQYRVLRDSSFGVNAELVQSPYKIISGQSLYAQPDGKIVFIGQRKQAGSSNLLFCISRINADGSLDPTFNGTGRNEEVAPFNLESYRVTMEPLPDKQCVIGGPGKPGTAFEKKAVLWKYKEDGKRDLGFGNNGTLSFAADSAWLNVQDIENVGDTSLLIMLSNSPADSSNSRLSLVKIRYDGSIVQSFGHNGKISIPESVLYSGNGLSADQSGNIYINGNSAGGGLLKITPDGQLDLAFMQITAIGDFFGYHKVMVQPDGKIIAYDNYNNNYEALRMKRLLPDGSPDPDFSKDGVLKIQFFDGSIYPGNVLRLPGGKFLLSANNGGQLICINPNGSFDYSFDLDGCAVISEDSDNTGSLSNGGVAYLPDGKVLIMTQTPSTRYIRLVQAKRQ